MFSSLHLNNLSETWNVSDGVVGDNSKTGDSFVYQNKNSDAIIPIQIASSIHFFNFKIYNEIHTMSKKYKLLYLPSDSIYLSSLVSSAMSPSSSSILPSIPSSTLPSSSYSSSTPSLPSSYSLFLSALGSLSSPSSSTIFFTTYISNTSYTLSSPNYVPMTFCEIALNAHIKLLLLIEEDDKPNKPIVNPSTVQPLPPPPPIPSSSTTLTVSSSPPSLLTVSIGLPFFDLLRDECEKYLTHFFSILNDITTCSSSTSSSSITSVQSGSQGGWIKSLTGYVVSAASLGIIPPKKLTSSSTSVLSPIPSTSEMRAVNGVGSGGGGGIGGGLGISGSSGNIANADMVNVPSFVQRSLAMLDILLRIIVNSTTLDLEV
jgi:hypothetical protein